MTFMLAQLIPGHNINVNARGDDRTLNGDISFGGIFPGINNDHTLLQSLCYQEFKMCVQLG